MSRSDNTPWRPRDGNAGLRHPPPEGISWALPRGTGRYLRRKWAKRQRQDERAALRCREEPEPSRPRHSVIYDYW